ncbi:hypothetical protein AYI69_g1158 [Smittium culicis]|uniref:Uncharacterized protein n=1 Tax=Smittium culicis TaxID=133412 RepID=A0A1R1YR28_9FUNG|nr:hypothetical protein AYI69_g1158 [Smittium culicis]
MLLPNPATADDTISTKIQNFSKIVRPSTSDNLPYIGCNAVLVSKYACAIHDTLWNPISLPILSVAVDIIVPLIVATNINKLSVPAIIESFIHPTSKYVDDATLTAATDVLLSKV